jgi:hypothetical protein
VDDQKGLWALDVKAWEEEPVLKPEIFTRFRSFHFVFALPNVQLFTLQDSHHPCTSEQIPPPKVVFQDAATFKSNGVQAEARRCIHKLLNIIHIQRFGGGNA